MKFALVLPSASVLVAALASAAGAQSFQNNLTDIPVGGAANNSFTENVTFADIDADGDLDAVFADGGDFGNDRNRVWINQGGLQAGTVGVFVDDTAARLPSVLDDSRDIDFADVDDDGDLDFLASNTSGVTNQGSRWYINQGGLQAGTLGFFAEDTLARFVNLGVNDGTTTFSSVVASSVLGAGGFIDWSCDTGFIDMDNDGDMDLVNATYGNLSEGKVPTRMFLNDGAGYFEEYNPSGFQLTGTDLTNGDPGLWCEGTQKGQTTDTTGVECDIANIAISIDFADLDDDFDVDILHGEKFQLPRVFSNLTEENGGTLGWRDTSHAVMPGPDWAPNLGSYEQELGDLDDDGDIDIYGGNWDNVSDVDFRNNGDGTMATGVVIANSAQRHNEPVLIDVENDGDLDVAIASETNIERIYVNSGPGGGYALAQDLSLMPAGTTTALGVDAQDVDQDGDYDLFFANDVGEANTYLENITNIADTTAPRVPNLEQAPDRAAGFKPTVVRAHQYDNVNWDVAMFHDVELEYSVDAGPFTATAMKHSGGQVFRGEIPGLLEGVIDYRVRATDGSGNVGLSTTRQFTAGPCTGDPVSYCTAGTSASGCQAFITAAGTPSATLSSGFTLNVADLEGSKDGLFFYGTNGRQANTWGSGTSFVCVVPPRVRGGLLIGTGTSGACDGSFSQDLNARWCATCPKPSHNPGPGAVMQAQLWYRDPQNTSNQTSSMSDAIEFVVCP